MKDDPLRDACEPIRVIGAGHSHGWALRRAARKAGSQNSNFKFIFPAVGSKAFPPALCVDGNRGREPCAEIAEMLDGEDGNRIVFASAFFGNHHNIVGLIERDPPWDVAWSSSGATPVVPKRILSSAAFEEFLRSKLATLVELFSCIDEYYKVDGIIHFLSPPPASTNLKFRPEIVRDETLTSPSFRLDLWSRQAEIFDSVCKESGVHLVGVPEHCLDSRGYLLEEFSEDGVHGTDEFSVAQIELATSAIRDAGIVT